MALSEETMRTEMSFTPPADTDQLRVLFVGECNDFFTCLEESDTGGCRIHDVDELYLGLHDRRGTRDVKAAESACDASSVACGCDHRRLLGGERDQVVRAVDREVGGHADRDADDAEDVLDHAIGLVDGEAVGGVVDRDVCFGQVGLADDLGATCGDVVGPEIGDAAVDGPVVHRHVGSSS